MGAAAKDQAKYEADRAGVRAATRKRKQWAYVRGSALADWAATQNWETETPPPVEVQVRMRLGARLDARVEMFDDGTDDGKLYAVWRGIADPLEGEEPNFITNPPGPMIDIDLSARTDDDGDVIDAEVVEE